MAHRDAAASILLGGLLLSSAAHSVPIVRSVKNLVEMRGFIDEARGSVHDLFWTEYDIEVPKEQPKEEEKKEEPPPEPEPAPAPMPKMAAPKEAKAAPEAPPQAAQAGQTMTAKDDPDKPVDFSDFTMIQGSGSSYAGGVTDPNGKSNSAVYDRNAKGGGQPGGKGSGSGPPGPAPGSDGPDLSKAASPASRDWSCSHLFPPEADADDINQATVSIIVTVGPDGSPRSIKVTNDPGHGFGRAARTCALSQRYNAPLDHDGKPTTGNTAPFTVRFTR